MSVIDTGWRSDNERYGSLFVSRQMEPLITGQRPPTNKQLAVEYRFENVKQVGNALTNVLRMFKQRWREVFHDDVGTQDDQAIADAIRDARMSVRMARVPRSRKRLLSRSPMVATPTIGLARQRSAESNKSR
jgi:hypothetical protein